MAEEIQGLKIVFGADFDQFQRQLTTANKAINTTQKHLRTLDKALKLDPESAGLLTEKMSALASQAQNVGMKIGALKQQIASASEQARRMAASEENMAMGAAQALAAYNKLNASLATVKDGMEGIAKAHGMAFDREKPLEFVAAIEKAGTATDAEKEKLRELSAEYQRLNAKWQGASSANATAQEALKLKTSAVDLERYRAELSSIYSEMSRIEYMDLDKTKSAEFRKIAQAADLCESEISALEERSRQLDAALKINPKNIDALTERLGNSRDAVQAMNAKVAALRYAMKELGVEEESVKDQPLLKLKQAAAGAQEQFERLNAELGETRGKISLAESEIKDFANGAKRAGATSSEGMKALEESLSELVSKEKYLKEQTDRAAESLRAMSAAVKGKEAASEIGVLEARVKSLTTVSKGASYAISASVRDFATTASATITPLLSIGMTGMVSKADELDTAFRSMTKTVNGTDSQFQKLKDDAIAFSQTHAVSASQILDIEAMGGQLGIAVDNLGEFAEVASNLDIATDMDADTIAEQLGQFNNVLEWGEGDMGRFGDALVRLGNNMPVQESKISSVATQIASMGSLVGMSTPEILAWSAAIASTGQGAESSGTAIQNTMSDIETAVAGGGDKLQAFADVAGLSADEFSSAWESGRASDVMKSFVEGLRGIEEDGGSATQVLSDLGITGVRQVRAIEGLMKTVGTLDEALEMSGDAWYGLTDQWGKAGDAANEAEKKQQGLSGSLQIMRNNAENLASVAGEQLVPYVHLASGALEGLTGALQGTNGWITLGVVGFAGIVAAAGPVVRVVSQAHGSFVNLNSILSKHRENLINAAVAAGKLDSEVGANAIATGKYSKEVRAATKEVASMTRAQKLMSAASMAGKAALIGVAIAALASLISYVAKCREEQERARAASVSLKDSYSTLSSAAQEGGSAISSSMGSAAQNAKAAADDIIQKNLDLISSFNDHMNSVIETNAEMDVYAEQLHSLGSDMSSLSEGDATMLETTLDGLNQLLGTHYELVAGEDGAYQIMQDGAEATIDSIDRLIQKKREEVQVEAYQQLAIENAQALAAAQNEQKVAADNLTQAQTDYNNMLALASQGYPGASESLEGYSLTLQQAKSDYDKATQGVDALKSKQQELDGAIAICTASIGENATATERALGSSSDWTVALAEYGVQGMQDFAAYCDDAGISVDQLQSASASNISQMISDWGSWAQSTNDALGEAADAISSMPDDAGDALGEVPSAAQESVDDTTTVLETLEDVMDYVSKNGVDGLVSGLESGQVRVSAAAQKLVNAARRTLTFNLQIKSPSRVMRRIGRFTGEGFALGIRDESRNVERMAGGLAEGAAGAIRDGSYASELGAAFASSSRSFNTTQQTVNSGDTMIITNLTVETKDADSAESLYQQLRKVQMKNRR